MSLEEIIKNKPITNNYISPRDTLLKEENYFLSDMNSRNGTSVNGRLLRPDEEYQLEPEDEVDFAQARYIFLE